MDNLCSVFPDTCCQTICYSQEASLPLETGPQPHCASGLRLAGPNLDPTWAVGHSPVWPQDFPTLPSNLGISLLDLGPRPHEPWMLASPSHSPAHLGSYHHTPVKPSFPLLHGKAKALEQMPSCRTSGGLGETSTRPPPPALLLGLLLTAATLSGLARNSAAQNVHVPKLPTHPPRVA